MWLEYFGMAFSDGVAGPLVGAGLWERVAYGHCEVRASDLWRTSTQHCIGVAGFGATSGCCQQVLPKGLHDRRDCV